MNIQPTYVTFKQAVWLKEKGFDVEVGAYYHTDKSIRTISDGWLNEVCSAPEHWQVVDWLFQKYRFSVEVHLDIPESGKHDGCYVFYGVVKSDKEYKLNIFYKTDMYYPTREKAYSAAFDYVLNNLI